MNTFSKVNKVIRSTFSCQSRTDSTDGWTDIATLVKCALAEVCSDPVLLVLFGFIIFDG